MDSNGTWSITELLADSSEALDPECSGPLCSRPLCLCSMNRPFTFKRTCVISVTIPTPPAERSAFDFFLPIRLFSPPSFPPFLSFLCFSFHLAFLISKLVDIMYKTPPYTPSFRFFTYSLFMTIFLPTLLRRWCGAGDAIFLYSFRPLLLVLSFPYSSLTPHRRLYDLHKKYTHIYIQHLPR